MRLETNSTYGKVVYEESFWTGKKQIYIQGQALTKTGKNAFEYNTEDGVKTVLVIGGAMQGAKLSIDGQAITLFQAPKWYEIALSALILAAVIVWSNSLALCSIFPIVGGALGGAVAGVMMFACIMLMRSCKSIPLKLAIWLGMLVGTFLICFLLALAFLSAVI